METLSLEARMINILRKNNIPATAGKYRNALYRLVKKGLVVKKDNEFCLTLKGRINNENF